MRVSAPEILELVCVDEIVPEPTGGAHTDPAAAAELLKDALKKNLSELKVMTPETLVAVRQRKLRDIARFYTQA
jgi:acetyl-CoA carboxylase alpha subunit